ncbi:hypothetical protein HYV86_03575 [Candidatus Woesearchaeota archaeon]|nr:hypothetical protein [Candidatus Woesearchaeota archaeon]
MIISLSDARADMFDPWTRTEIVSNTVGPTRFTQRALARLVDDGKVVIATHEADLGTLVDGTYNVDHEKTIQAAKEVRDDQLLILPIHAYRIVGRDAHQLTAYETGPFVNLDSIDVRRKVIGADAQSGVSKTGRETVPWNPEVVLKAAFDRLHNAKEENIDKVFLGYRWQGNDGRRRVVTFMNAHEGVELRLFQNLAFLKLGLPILETELETQKEYGTKKPLSATALIERRKKLERNVKYVQDNSLEPLLKDLDVSLTDLVEIIGKQFNYGTGFIMQAPSRHDPPKQYKFQLLRVPRVPKGQESKAYSMVWDLEGSANPEDTLYQSQRRIKTIGVGASEVFFSPHEIAAYHALRVKYARKPRPVPINPFVIPKKDMADYVDRLRYGTLLVGVKDGKFQARPLIETEIGRLIGMKAVAEGYEQNLTTERGYFKESGHDPQKYLTRLVP